MALSGSSVPRSAHTSRIMSKPVTGGTNIQTATTPPPGPAEFGLPPAPESDASHPSRPGAELTTLTDSPWAGNSLLAAGRDRDILHCTRDRRSSRRRAGGGSAIPSIPGLIPSILLPHPVDSPPHPAHYARSFAEAG